AVLGLDAKNPAIILPDADLENTVNECILGALSFNGQRCTALKILFVHNSIANEFIKKLSDGIAKLKPGMPWEAGVGLTPMAEPGKTTCLRDLVDDAKLHGAKVMNPHGGEVLETFFYPAILFPVNDKMKVYYEEQFGPVIPVIAFEDEQEAVKYVVKSHF